MNQPATMIPDVAAPLQQLKVQLISKGYSYHEVKEANAVISIFKSSGIDPQVEEISLPSFVSN
jgi:hypothetical protein